ncbi:LysR family transcriptional regulator [Aquabacterium sp.]|uniref:LysR family transcriptional regulator n=1 Tax=Aquabacterium sp. TaxID=1872578 RepID=UPI002C2A8674|nr:LysR family transcriptional regulator [Aquabacterium sp.]HSW08837.1 LysR family transcriptional regulator [Aquabacterium sp.]
MVDLDANDLMLFARVAEAGSFSRAAERVRLPKSTVSRRIAALEKRFGERLLQRSTRKLSITEFGVGVLDHARALAAEVDGAQALAQHRQAKPSGRLRVSMPGDFAGFALPQMLASFVQEHPAIVLELDLSPRRVDLIGENFDLAVRMGELPDDSQLAARKLAAMTMGLYAAPAYLQAIGMPASPDDLLALHGLMLLSRSGDSTPWQLERGSGSSRERWSGAPVQHTLANSPDVLMRMAQAGVGVVMVPDFYALAQVQGGALVRVLPDWCLPAGNCWAVFPGRRLMPARTRAFLDALVATMGTCTESSVVA